MQEIKKRSDAQLHRTLLLDAADKVFSEHGVHVALELVTAQAGVSRATLYRNFPDRDALMGWLKGFKQPPRRTFVVHGEAETARGFADQISHDLGWRAEAPARGACIEI